MPFHRRCGDRVTLLNENLTATRNFIEFNHGVILSAEPLVDDVVFEVRIDKMVESWNGTVEIGVTDQDPETMELPATATRLGEASWLLSGKLLMKNGLGIRNNYGTGLDHLVEGDNIGVMRSSKGELKFFVNGQCLGIAARDLPEPLYGVIDLYGKCVQVTINDPPVTQRPLVLPALPSPPVQLPLSVETETSAEQLQEDATSNDNTTVLTELETAGALESPQSKCPDDDVRLNLALDSVDDTITNQDNLRFHSRCGILVTLSNNNRTAERARPIDDYNNGVVMTHRPLCDGELFEIRIDRLIDKWSGSIEVGITSHNPATLRFPNTMTNMECGTVMMSGCKILINGHATGNEYGYSNLDELREGDTVGMMRTAAGKLHYFVNGVDQGVAFDKLDAQVWGVIDLYGMTVKATIVDGAMEIDSRQCGAMVENNVDRTLASRLRPHVDEDTLLFHTLRDSDVVIINDGKTAHRPNAFEHFHNGVVMTNRTLKTNELFQVRLDVVVPKWAGSIEIGVTQHLCNEIIFPFKMSNAKSGTWAMTGEDVVRDGSVIIPQYVRDLSKLVEGDTVGVMRKEMGILHFFVNGVDQGMAAFNVPEHVFGIIDLYGKVAQASIVDYAPPPVVSSDSNASSESNGTMYPELCFHRVHGHNVHLRRSRQTAQRRSVHSEFSDAVLFSSRPLRECEMFEIRIEQTVDCWMGSLEIGVTAIRPEELESAVEEEYPPPLTGTAGDLSWNTYILSGSSIMKDGELVLSGYPLDLDNLTVGSRVGLMWHADRSLHYYLDGLDQGRAFDVPHLNIYAVIDIYGQCTQVSILQSEERGCNYACHSDNSTAVVNPRNIGEEDQSSACFSEYCGDKIWMSEDYRVAVRRSVEPTGGLVFSSDYLRTGDLFQINIVRCKSPYHGSLRLGLTDINILNAHVNRSLPSNITQLPNFTTYIDGDQLMRSMPGEKEHWCLGPVQPTFDWLSPGDTVALLKTSNNRVQVYLNSQELDVVFENVPDKVFVAAELYGSCTVVKAIANPSNVAQVVERPIYYEDMEAQQWEQQQQQQQDDEQSDEEQSEQDPSQIPDQQPPEQTLEQPQPGCSFSHELMQMVVSSTTIDTPDAPAEESPRPPADIKPRPFTFHPVCGSNVQLLSSDTVASRECSFNHGIAVVGYPMQVGQTCSFRIDKLEKGWDGHLMIGAVTNLPLEDLPENALQLNTQCWVIDFKTINYSGTLIPSQMGRQLENVEVNTILGLHFTAENSLELYFNGELCCSIFNLPEELTQLYPLVDVYGQCTQVSILLQMYKIRHSAPANDLLMCMDDFDVYKNDTGEVYEMAEWDEGEEEEVGNEGDEVYEDEEQDEEDFVEDVDDIFHEYVHAYVHDVIRFAGGFSETINEDAELAALVSGDMGEEFDEDIGEEIGEEIIPDVGVDQQPLEGGPRFYGHDSVDDFENFNELTGEIFDRLMRRVPLDLDDIIDFIPDNFNDEMAIDVEEIDNTSDEAAGELFTERDAGFSDRAGYMASNECVDDMADETVYELPDEFVDDFMDDIDYEEADEPLIQRVPREQSVFMSDMIADETSDSIADEIIDEVADDDGDLVYEISEADDVADEQLDEAVYMYIAGEEVDDVANHVAGNVTGQRENDCENVTVEVFNEITERVTEEAADNLVNEVSEQSVDKATYDLTEEITNEINEEMADEVKIVLSEDVNDKLPDELSEEVRDKINTAGSKKTMDKENDVTEEEGDKIGVAIPYEDYYKAVDNLVVNLPISADWVQQETGAFVFSQPGPSTSNHDQQLLQVLTQSMLGVKRRRISATPNDIFNREIQRSKSNHGSLSEPEKESPCNDRPQTQRPFEMNQRPTVLRELSTGGYEDVTAIVHRDPNVRHNAFYPELNMGDDSLDSDDIINAMSNMESNNWPDLNDERSSSGYEATNASESFGHQEMEVAHYANSNFGYLKNLIFCDDEPVNRIEYDGDEGSEVVGACEYLHTVLKYWRDLVPHFPGNRQSVMWGNIECHCHVCDETAPPCLAGWVRIRRELPPPMPNAERVYWNVDGSLLRWVLLSDSNTLMHASSGRPSSLQIIPSSAPYFSTLWFDEERKPLRASIAIEIDKNYDENGVEVDPKYDRMISLLLRLEPPVPNLVEDDLPIDDDFDYFE